MATLPSLTQWAGQAINYEIYDEGERFLGTASLELPELTYLTQTITGAGIAGEVEMPSRWLTGSLTLKITWRSMTQWTMHLAEQNRHDITAYAAVNLYESGAAGVSGAAYSQGAQFTNSGVHAAPTDFKAAGQTRAMPIKIMARCLPKRTAFGKFQPNELMESESEFELTYLKVTIDGSDELELDKFNYILKIHGVDYAGDVRSALGLG